MLAQTSQTGESGAPPLRLALIAMPWTLFNRPSIQLGVLKAYLEKTTRWLEVETFHPYLEIASKVGTRAYHWISQDMWLSEALYGIILFPELENKARLLIKKKLRKAEPDIRTTFDLDRVLTIIREQIAQWIRQHDWGRYLLTGFSVSANQLLSSLAAARLIKSVRPQAPIVFGGSSCAQNIGFSLLRNFSQIDYIVSGEGELPLLRLCEFLANRSGELPPGILAGTRGDSNMPPSSYRPVPPPSEQLDNLEGMPVPDYRNYYRDLRIWFKDEPFIPILPVEFSRGCWWRKCAFCNLNLQWRGYRQRRHSQVLGEIITLADRHASLDFAFTDNVLPPKESTRFFEKIADLNRDFRFFGEIRADTQAKGRRQHFKTYSTGGLTSIQVGIEALSNTLLTKMGKGTSVLENIAAMKDALQYSIKLDGNLITEFPGSSRDEVEETIHNLDFVLPYHPLAIAAFFLGAGSPVDKDPRKYGIQAVKPHRHSTRIFPGPILDRLDLLIKDYRGDRTAQRKLWRPVAQKVEAWHDFYRRRGRSALDMPPLSYRDGGSYIIIRQELPQRPTMHHRLRKLSREIYLFCGEARDENEIKTRFAAIDTDRLVTFLDSLVRKRLMLKDNGRYLSLAVRTRGV